MIEQVDLFVGNTNFDEEDAKKKSLFAYYLWTWVRAITNLVKIFHNAKKFAKNREVAEAKKRVYTEHKVKIEQEIFNNMREIEAMEEKLAILRKEEEKSKDVPESSFRPIDVDGFAKKLSSVRPSAVVEDQPQRPEHIQKDVRTNAL